MAGTMILEAAVNGFFQALFQALGPLAQEGLGRLWGVDDQVKKLPRMLLKIQTVLHDAERRQVMDEGVREWMNDLRDLAYEMDDIGDEMNTERLRLKVVEGINKESDHDQVSHFFSTLKLDKVVDSASKIPFSYAISGKINKVMDRLDELAKEADDLGLQRAVAGGQIETVYTIPSSPSIDESCIYGRDGDKEMIKKKLINSDESSSSTRNYSIIPIVGMGGIGKTTITQLVFNDKFVVKHFDLRIWTCVSEPFDVNRVTRDMIEYATGENCPVINIGALHKKLENFLNGKKFLIVLDDVWTESCDDWDRLRSPLRVGAKGSKIIVTTRSEKVCKMMSLLEPIHLSFLPNHYCWALFKEKAFGESSSSNVAPNLEAMGMKIVEKCKGLPLAVKVLGGALRCTRDEERWKDIFESEIWNLPQGLFPALRLSYQHLPLHLKRCFEYCSLFPADYKFERNMLVRLWMAEGLLPTQGKRQPEDIGSECFDELLWRSFFQIYEKFLGYYTMHGLLHSLGSSVGGKFYFRTASATQPSIATEATRHSYMTETLTLLTEAKQLRTLIRVKSLRVLEFIDRVMEFKCLRVLDLGNCSLTVLPESIGDLKHLRYLILVKNLIKYLPHSICNLYNMQTLDLMYCANLVSLPKCIGNLINLRYLSIEGCKNLKSLPQGIRKLTCLTKLDVFLVGKESREEGIRALKDMNKLRGHLDISNLENIGNVEESISADLMSKQYLTKMVLEWRNNDGVDRAIDADVLEALRPHTNLREIIIQGYGGTILPTWMGDSSFSNLTRVKLYCCKNAKSLSPLGRLPALQSLVINRMDGVKHVGTEFFYGGVDATSQSFPSLEELYIGSMVNLEDWCGVEVKWQLRHFSRLRKFIIFDCPQLRKLYFDATDISRGSNLGIPSSHISLPSLTSTNDEGQRMQCASRESPLASLQCLVISKCRSLKSLPQGLHNLASLQKLKISCCFHLESLPENGLPEGLQYLCIIECPTLAKRCLEEGSKEWKMVQHIPHTNIL